MVLLRTEVRAEGGLGSSRLSPAPRRLTVRLGDRSYMKHLAGFIQRTWLCLSWWHRSVSPAAKRWTSRTGLWAPALPLTPSVMLGQAQTLPKPQFPHLEQGVTV